MDNGLKCITENNPTVERILQKNLQIIVNPA